MKGRAEAPREPRHKREPRRSRVLALGVAGLLVASLCAAGLIVFLPREDEPSDNRVATSNSVTTGSTTGPSPGSSPGTAAESSIRARLTPDGTAVTSQRVSSAEPFEELRLTVWSPPPGGGSVPTFRPELRDVIVTADGQRVLEAPTTLSSGETVTVSLPIPANKVRLQFRGLGQLDMTDKSVPDRALALVDALDVQSPAVGDVAIRVSAPAILNMACASGVEPPAPCGEPDARGWHVEVSSGEVAVVVQVDLAQP